MANTSPMEFHTSAWLSEPGLRRCSPATKGLWMDTLAIMWEEGRTGVLTGSQSDLQEKLQCTTNQFCEFIKELKLHNVAKIEVSNASVTIINRRMAREEAKRQKANQRMMEYRGMVGNESVTLEYTPKFLEFYAVFPRQIEKRAAFKNWNIRLKEGADPDTLIEAAKRFRAQCEKEHREQQHIMYPQRFLGITRPYEDYLPGRSSGLNDEDAELTAQVCYTRFKEFDYECTKKKSYCEFCHVFKEGENVSPN